MSFFRRRQEPIKIYQTPEDFIAKDVQHSPATPWDEGGITQMRPIPPEPKTLPEMPPRFVGGEEQTELKEEAKTAWSIFQHRKK